MSIMNLLKEQKEVLKFFFTNNVRVKTVVAVTNTLILLSNHPSYKNLASHILIKINDNKYKNQHKKTLLENLKSVKVKNDEIIKNDKDVLAFLSDKNLNKYVPNKSMSNFLIDDFYLLFNRLNDKIIKIQWFIRVISVLFLILSIVLSFHYKTYIFLNINILSWIIICITMSLRIYNFQLAVKNISTEESSFENSIFSLIIKQKNIDILTTEHANQDLKLKKQKIELERKKNNVNKNLLIEKIKSKELKSELINDEMLKHMTNTDERKGVFLITDEMIKKNTPNTKEIMFKIFDYALESHLLKPYILLNMWKLIDKKIAISHILEWMKNVEMIDIISSTTNKNNLKILFEKTFYVKNSDTFENNKKYVNEIENIVLENMSIDEYLDVLKEIINEKQVR